MINIKKVNDLTLDVFTGVGWNNWSRFGVEFKGGRLLLKLIRGQPMRKEDFVELYEELK